MTLFGDIENGTYLCNDHNIRYELLGEHIVRLLDNLDKDNINLELKYNEIEKDIDMISGILDLATDYTYDAFELDLEFNNIYNLSPKDAFHLILETLHELECYGELPVYTDELEDKFNEIKNDLLEVRKNPYQFNDLFINHSFDRIYKFLDRLLIDLTFYLDK